MTSDIEAAARRIWSARDAGVLLSADETLGDISVGDAYRVQESLTANRVAGGEKIVGWKLGYTSAAMRSQMGIAEPNFGPLTDTMLLHDGGVVDDRLVQPKVEPEIALVFASPLSAVDRPLDRAGVLAGVGEARACLEVVHSTWEGYRFTLAQNTADGSSAAQVVLGGRLAHDDLARIEVRLEVDGELFATGVGADASGHPADGVVWLLDRLAERGLGLNAGDIVITGGLTRASDLQPDSRIVARYTLPGRPLAVSVSVTRRNPESPATFRSEWALGMARLTATDTHSHGHSHTAHQQGEHGATHEREPEYGGNAD